MKQCEFLHDVLRVNTRLFNKRKIKYFDNSLNHDDFNLRRKSCSCSIVKKNRSFIYYLDLLNVSDTTNHVKYPKIFRECLQRSGRAIGMLQTDCSIRKIRFWKCSMLLWVIQFRCFDYE
jgi:hypothetical protein